MSTTAEPKVQYIHSIHHTLFPSADFDRTKDFYEKVLGMSQIPVPFQQGRLPVLLMTNGNFDLHFCSPSDEINNSKPLAPYHFALEVEDWDTLIAHLDELGIAYDEVRYRPTNNSKTSEFRDPDGNLVEIVWHGDRDW